MPTFELSTIAGVITAMERDVQGFHLDQRRHLQRETLRQLQRLSPYQTGEFRNSWTPWGGGGPGLSRARAQGEETPATPADAAASLERLPLGADHGVATSDPAARRLVAGLSSQARPNFPESAIKLAMRASLRKAAKGSRS